MTMKTMPFVFGPSKLGVTPGGGGSGGNVDARKAARSRDVVVAAATTEDILWTADDEMKIKLEMKTKTRP